MERHSRFPGTLAEAAAEPARTLSSWQGAGELAAIPQPPCRAGDLARPPRWHRARPGEELRAAREGKGLCHLLWGGKKNKQGKRTFFWYGGFREMSLGFIFIVYCP